MRTFLTIFFTILYFTASSGVAVQMQLCKGKVVAMQLWLNDEDNCAKNCPSGKQKTKECCKSKQQQLKVDNFNTSADYLSKAISQVILPDYPTQVVLTPVSSNLVEYPRSNGPPAAGTIPLYIKNCTFII